DRRLEQVGGHGRQVVLVRQIAPTRRLGGHHQVDRLPGERLTMEDLLAGVGDQMLEVVSVVVPVEVHLLSRPGAVNELADQHGSLPLREEKEREAGADDRPAIPAVLRLFPGPRTIRVLFADEELAPLAVPVVLTEESLARESARPLETVEVVVSPRR